MNAIPDQSFWKVKARAVAAAFSALSPSGQALVIEQRVAGKERRRVSRAAKRALARRIMALRDDGASIEDIGRAVGRAPASVREFAAARGLLISRALHTVCRAIALPLAAEHALRRLALDAGQSPARTLEDLVALSLADDAAIARRILHVTRKARPDERASISAL